MACAFVRFQTKQMAQLAIEGIHGQFTLPDALEPLVVRWADPPGSRKRESRDRGSGNRRCCGNSMSGAYRGPDMSCSSRPGISSYMSQGSHGYAQMQMPMQAMGGNFGPAFYGPHMGVDQSIAGGYGGVHLGFIPPQQMHLMQYAQQPQAVGAFPPPPGGPQPMVMPSSRGMPPMTMHQQLGYQQFGVGMLPHDQPEALATAPRISSAPPPRGVPACRGVPPRTS